VTHWAVLTGNAVSAGVGVTLWKKVHELSTSRRDV
jgi:hypothetical protein